MSHSVHGSGEWIAHDRRDARIETASATKENHHYANRYLYSTIYLLIVDIDMCVCGGFDKASCVSSCKLSRSLDTAETGWVTI